MSTWIFNFKWVCYSVKEIEKTIRTGDRFWNDFKQTIFIYRSKRTTDSNVIKGPLVGGKICYVSVQREGHSERCYVANYIGIMIEFWSGQKLRAQSKSMPESNKNNLFVYKTVRCLFVRRVFDRFMPRILQANPEYAKSGINRPMNGIDRILSAGSAVRRCRCRCRCRLVKEGKHYKNAVKNVHI